MNNDSGLQTSSADTRGRRMTVKRGWIAAIVVAVAAAAIIFYKETRSRPSSGPVSSVAPGASSARGAERAAAGSVLLVADPDEAGSACGCGQIIRLVRGAGARGVAVREVAPGSNVSLEREYRVTVAPTVLCLDSTGHVVARHQGEGPETIEAIRSGLDRLAGDGR